MPGLNPCYLLVLIMAFSRKFVSAPVIKCKKTPRKKCSFMAEEAKKKIDSQ